MRMINLKGRLWNGLSRKLIVSLCIASCVGLGSFQFINVPERHEFKKEQELIKNEIPQRLSEIELYTRADSLEGIASDLYYFGKIDQKNAPFPCDLGGYNEVTRSVVRPIRDLAYEIGAEYLYTDDGMAIKWNKSKAIQNIGMIDKNHLLDVIETSKRLVDNYNSQEHHYHPFIVPALGLGIFAGSLTFLSYLPW